MKILIRALVGVFVAYLIVMTFSLVFIREREQSEVSWIIFESNADGPAEIFRMANDGRLLRQLTQNSVEDQMPRWSPDGKWIAFMSLRDGNPEIYRMRTNGRDVLRLTHNQWGDWEPRWSPDSEWIIFMSTPTGGGDLFRIRPDGSGMQKITDTPGTDNPPSFSADGKWMTYTTDGRTGASAIMLIRSRLDGSEAHVIAERLSGGLNAAWSPTNEAYIYRSSQLLNSDTGELNLISLRDDSTARITSNTANDFSPTWSVDGEWIHFGSDRDGNWELYRMRPDGSEVERLTKNDAQDYWSIWSPSGEWMLFISGRDETLELYKMRPDGSDQQRLTYQEGREVNHSWSPIIDYGWHPIRLMVASLLVVTGVGFGIFRGGRVRQMNLDSV